MLGIAVSINILTSLASLYIDFGEQSGATGEKYSFLITSEEATGNGF